MACASRDVKGTGARPLRCDERRAAGNPPHCLRRSREVLAGKKVNGDRRNDGGPPGRDAGSSGHSLCGRLRRRHATRRRSLHRTVRRIRERPGNAAELPGRDPRAGRHGRGRLVVPGAHLRPRHRHAGRRAERARRDEPGRAEGEHERPLAGQHAAHQRRRVRRAQPREGGLPVEPARGRFARRVQRLSGTDDVDHGRSDEGARRQAPRRGTFEELLRARPALLDVHATDEADHRVDRAPFRRQGQRPQREPRRVQGRPELRRDRRALRPPLRGRAGAAAQGHLSQHRREPRVRRTASSPRLRRRSSRSSTRRIRSPPPPTSSTSCRRTRTSG